MNTSSNQLETVFHTITKYFDDYPGITVTPGEGELPESYTITYSRAGVCQKADGTITTCSSHSVTISIPFGFPQFPPDCQPESSTFHPNFSSSAIYIDDAWEADPSIVKLILHIGRMISGKFYSKTHIFNNEAEEWYQANSDRLPFNESNAEHETDTLPESEDAAPEGSSSYTIDILDDEAFEQSFSLEKSTPSDTTLDINFLQILAKQKRFHELTEELQKSSEQFDGRAALEEEAQSALNTAIALFQEANDLEHQGKQKETLEKLNTIEDLVSDDPLLKKAKLRVQQAFDLLGDWVSTAADDTPDQPRALKPQSSESQPPTKAFIEETNSTNRTKTFLAIGGGALVLCALLLTAYVTFSSKLKKGENRYLECQRLLDTDNFIGAEKKCEEALEFMGQTYIFKQNEKNQLTGKVRSLLDSPKLRQGLKGKTLLNGTYVTQADRKIIRAFGEAMESGDTFFTNGRWQEAAQHYHQALALTKKIDFVSSNSLTDMNEKITRTQIYLSIEKGKEAFAASQWDTAITHYDNAIKLLEKNAPLLQGIDVNKISAKLSRIKLHAVIIRDRQNVTKYLHAKHYNSAMKQLQAIKKTITTSTFADQPEFQTILKEISTQIEETDQQLSLVTLTNYLTENYKTLFLNHHPSATRAKLTKPRIEYLKRVGNKLLFRMRCTETAGSRPLRLQMDYLYSPADKSWRFYSEE